MTTFKQLVNLHWNFSANNCRVENVLDQLFLTNGNGLEWHNGELQYKGDDKDGGIGRTTPESIAEHAWSQADYGKDHLNFSDDGETIEDKASYWYDNFLDRYLDQQAIPIVTNMYLTDRYDAITRIPDNITVEYASALLLVCDWFDTITHEELYKGQIESTRRFLFGGFYERDKELIEANPKWKAISDTHKANIKDLDPIDRCLFKDPEWSDMIKEVHTQLKKELEPVAEKRIKDLYDTIVKYRTQTRQKIKTLHPSACTYDIQALALTRNLDLPTWYIEDKNRKGHNHYEKGEYKD